MLGGRRAEPRAQQMLKLLAGWNGSRLDANGDGKIDDPGAAIMDAWWPKLAGAELQPVLGPLTDELEALESSRTTRTRRQLVRLRLVRLRRQGPALGARRQGRGPVRDEVLRLATSATCRASVWAALDAAGAELAAAQGADPSAWRADATKERIRFAGFIPDTMRWTNRPTFQQVVVFRSHR